MRRQRIEGREEGGFDFTVGSTRQEAMKRHEREEVASEEDEEGQKG